MPTARSSPGDSRTVGAAQALRRNYSTDQALEVLRSSLGLARVQPLNTGMLGVEVMVGATSADPVLPDQLVVAATGMR